MSLQMYIKFQRISRQMERKKTTACFISSALADKKDINTIKHTTLLYYPDIIVQQINKNTIFAKLKRSAP